MIRQGFSAVDTMPTHRSWLLTPCTGESAMAAALESGADALVVELGAGGPRAAARERTCAFLAGCDRAAGPAIFVMIAALDDPDCDADVRALAGARPAGLVLPRAAGGADAARLGALLAAAEAEAGLDDGSITVLPLATQTPASVFGLGTYAGATGRLAGLAWYLPGLRDALGSRAAHDETGALTTPYALVRNLCLIGASSAGVPAIDHAGPEEGKALIDICNAAWRDGFSGKLALSAAQVPVINGIFGARP